MIIKIDNTQLKIFAKMCKDAPQSFNVVTAEYLNASAFRHRELNIKSLESKMVIRDKRFLLSSLRVEKTRPLPIDKQIAISGSINRPRFSGWKEQETGQTPVHKRVSTPTARGGSMRGKIQTKARLKPGNVIYKPEQYQGKSYQLKFYFMMRVLGSRGGGQFLVSQRIPTKKGGLNPGLYNLKGRKVSLLQKLKGMQSKRIEWQSKDWSDIKRRAELNSKRSLDIWKARQAAKGLI